MRTAVLNTSGVGAVPFPFDANRTLWLRIKAQDAHILFTGAKLNYRRKRVTV